MWTTEQLLAVNVAFVLIPQLEAMPVAQVRPDGAYLDEGRLGRTWGMEGFMRRIAGLEKQVPPAGGHAGGAGEEEEAEKIGSGSMHY